MIKKTFYFRLLLCLLFISQLQAQNKHIDSLQTFINSYNKNDTVKVNILNELAYEVRKSDKEKILKYSTEARDLSKKIGYKKGSAESLRLTGIYYAMKGNYSVSLKYFHEATELFESINYQRGIIKCYNTLGLTYYNTGQYAKSAEYYSKLIEINTVIGNKTEVISSLNMLGSISLSKGEFSNALIFYNKSINQSKEINDKSGLSKSYNNVGLIHFNQGDFPKAIEFYKKAVNVLEEISDKYTLPKSYNNIGSSYSSLGDYPQAIFYYQKSLKICEAEGDKKGLSSCYNNIGIVYDMQGDYKLALEYYFKALNLAEEINDKQGICSSLNNIGVIYKNNGNYALANKYYNRALKIYEELGNNFKISYMYNNIGDIFSIEKKFSEAIQFYNKSLKIAETTGLKSIIVRANLSFCNLFYDQNKFLEASIYGEKAYKIATEIRDKEKIKEAAELLSKIHSTLGNFKKAYSYQVEFKAQSDSLFNEANIKKITGMEYQYKYEKEKELAILEQQKKDAIKEEELKREKTLRNSFIGGFILVLMLFSLMIYMFVQKRKNNLLLKEQKQEIEEKNKILLIQKSEIEIQKDELKSANTKLIKLDEFKKSLTSMIVHDLKNPLNTIINTIGKDPLKSLNQVKASGKQMLNMVLNILDINKYEETQMKVEASQQAVYKLAQNAIEDVIFLATQKNISINNKLDLNEAIKAEEEIIKRVFVNLLTNAIKHSPNNGTINISGSIVENNKFVKIKVSDNGQGIPNDKLSHVFEKFGQVNAKDSGSIRSTGLGLTFCKLAVEAHGGKIGVKSSIGKGTEFWFTIPRDCYFDFTQEVIYPKTEEDITLTAMDKNLLKPYVVKLKTLMVFQTSEIEKVISSLENKDSIEIKKWIEAIKTSTFVMNEDKYSELLNLVI